MGLLNSCSSNIAIVRPLIGHKCLLGSQALYQLLGTLHSNRQLGTSFKGWMSGNSLEGL